MTLQVYNAPLCNAAHLPQIRPRPTARPGLQTTVSTKTVSQAGKASPDVERVAAQWCFSPCPWDPVQRSFFARAPSSLLSRHTQSTHRQIHTLCPNSEHRFQWFYGSQHPPGGGGGWGVVGEGVRFGRVKLGADLTSFLTPQSQGMAPPGDAVGRFGDKPLRPSDSPSLWDA
ncbi:hypothetical protein M433DRAFT_502090 [Acidomyces richmondensis BFW]|nr:MAG: hypothetical protein FE78DRAFT_304667 [Acidomyces sp. 'richmondensis']KYG47338.1 hypothetical protein M433DRAFT_502090 [Acidomyces richmondensis BFW]